MDVDILLPEAQAPIPSPDSSRSLPQTPDDKWNAYKDEIHKVYIKQNNTLEATMKIIEEQGGPKASKRTWKLKLKEWAYEKYLTSKDMSIISAKAQKRKIDDGKGTIFYHWDSEIPAEKIKRFKKTPKASEIASPSAETPPNVRYHTPETEHQNELTEIQRDQQSFSFADVDFLPPMESRALPTNDPISEFDNIAFSELETAVVFENNITETFMVDLQATNVDRRQDLHFTPDRATRTSSPLFLQPISSRGSPIQTFNELWNHDFDEVFNRNNLDQACSNAFATEGFNNSHHMMFFGEEYQITSSFPIGTSSPIALYNIPWFRFQHSLKTTGSLSYSPRMSQVSHLFTPSFDIHLTSLDLAHSAVELKERFRLLCSLFRSPPCSMEKNFLSEFSSKLQELIPESFEGEIPSKLHLLFHPSNDSPLQVLSEFALYFLSNNMLNEEQKNKFLEWAIEKKPKELFRSLFSMKIPTVDSFSENIIECAARTGNASILRFLIQCGLDKRYFTGISGGRYLQLALLNTNPMGVVHLLLDNGANVNPPLMEHYPCSHPPLTIAAMRNCVEAITSLLEAGAEVNTNVDDSTALVYALLNTNCDIVHELLQAGADVDDCKLGEQTMLDWAYLHSKSIYQMILPKSRKAKVSLTMSGILSAANKSKRALSQYLDGKGGKNMRSQQKVLEDALMYAISKEKDYNAISVLLDFGVDPNVTTIDASEPPLVIAATNNDIILVQQLLNAGANIDSSIIGAVPWNKTNFDILNFFIEQGADISTFGGKALRSALYNHSAEGFRLLVSLGASINGPNSYEGGSSLLAEAAKRLDAKDVKYLISKGAVINEPLSAIAQMTALQAAAAEGNLEVVKFLLDAGADVNAEPSWCHGMTALEASLVPFGLNEEHVAIFQLLLNKGADINGPNKRRVGYWNPALVKLIRYGADPQLIQLALRAGGDVNRCGKGMGARTPLQAASEVGNLELVKQLLEKGAAINAKPSASYGRTALQAACASNNLNLELVRYLLKGAEINTAACTKQGLTALQGVAIQGHIKIALMLLEAGAEVNAEPAPIEGRMALDGAAEHGRLDMVQMLLNFGAKSEVPGDTGFDNAIRLARENGRFAVARFLESYSNS